MRLDDEVCVQPTEHAARLLAQGRVTDLGALCGVLLLYQNSVFRQVTARYRGQDAGHVISGALHVAESPGGDVGIVGGFGVGAPATALVLEQLAALGVRRAVAVGTAGALQPDLGPGSAVLCTFALRGEGVSGHYWSPADRAFPSPDLTCRLAQALDDTCDDRFHHGGTWTTDAPYRETRAEVSRHAAAGVLTVDMEAAALFAVARYRDVDCAAAFAISDSLVTKRRTPGRRSPAVTTTLTELADGAVSVLRTA
ncbi:nucleoside phosphorylase [Streptomyces tendae]|uniref:nucleoside phosphorylase n=1 Tax=Streptomyces tendae TaxID=1932 RepID=UPI0033C9DE33